MNGEFPRTAFRPDNPWIGWALATGLSFVCLFNLMAFSAQKVGVAVTSVVSKISLVIPFLFSLYLYDENFTTLKGVGVVLALLSVVLTCLRGKEESNRHEKIPGYWLIIVPLIIFVWSGLLDTMIKFTEQRFLDETNYDRYLVTAFGIAAGIGSLCLLILYLIGKQRISGKAMLAGICIGIPNYFSMWFLVRVLKYYAGNSSAIIPVNNMGIVLLSSVLAWIIFREKLTPVNWVGILLALVSIAMIAYG